ncbi:gephyrin-like molybdotransferase Glp [Ruania zhangjianzhongii]|uniref:molybdopterin molybdotransferase MoeA n=1 Tax=Ruania zhangjianzhongii TaxID=2603206 RepID=UPI0011CC2231|nr:gephyrin-like molybdotransferase Glp [Ruania zhangjianzhongii]
MAKSVSAHLKAVLELLGPLPPLDVMLTDASGCILAEDVSAGGDLPPTDLAAYDGYAVRSRDVDGASASSPVTVRVLGDLLAGATHTERLVAHSGVRVASGAHLPAEADAVVPITGTDEGAASVTVYADAPAGAGIRRTGEDLRSGELALASGRRVGDRQIALLGALGRARVAVHPRPRVVVLPVGDELRSPGLPSGSGGVYDANGHALATGVQDVGGRPFRAAPVGDDHGVLRETLEDQLVRADLILTTGGLSDGAHDTVKEVLALLGEVRFDNVAIHPGRQFGIGTIGEGTPIVCLPGDPATAQIAFEVFVRPALLAMAGHSELYRPTVTAAVARGWTSADERRQFVPVTLTGSPDAGYRASPLGPPERPSLNAMSRANALAVVPENITEVAAGDTFACLVLES